MQPRTAYEVPRPKRTTKVILLSVTLLLCLVMFTRLAVWLLWEFRIGGIPDIGKSQAREIAKACEVYRERHGHYPKDLKELLNPNQPGGPIWKDQRALLDPWGEPYQLELDRAGKAVIISNGGGQRRISSAD